MNLSYWEIKNWFTNIDFTVVGSGIVGLHCALALRQKYPDSKILILEKGFLPQGASTKNAGFACFGSISEIINDLKIHSQQEVIDLVTKRKKGLELLRKNLGDNNINYEQNGGFELFLENNATFFETCNRQLGFINHVLKPVFEKDVFVKVTNHFKFQKICNDLILNPFEAQIDTGNMMQALLKKAISNGILILNEQELMVFNENSSGVEVGLKNFSFQTKKLFFATNGFASKLTNNEVKPARAQVLITEPIANLHLKGTFHLDEGYYYFRNIDNRVLLGGGRNLDFKGETTTKFAETEIIQNHLEDLLKNVILPNTKHGIAHRWSGIMGIGESKKPIVKTLSNHVYCGVRLGGMGIAIGSLVGAELAALCDI